jgi:hypothetical protein
VGLSLRGGMGSQATAVCLPLRYPPRESPVWGMTSSGPQGIIEILQWPRSRVGDPAGASWDPFMVPDWQLRCCSKTQSGTA